MVHHSRLPFYRFTLQQKGYPLGEMKTHWGGYCKYPTRSSKSSASALLIFGAMGQITLQTKLRTNSSANIAAQTSEYVDETCFTGILARPTISQSSDCKGRGESLWYAIAPAPHPHPRRKMSKKNMRERSNKKHKKSDFVCFVVSDPPKNRAPVWEWWRFPKNALNKLIFSGIVFVYFWL